MKKSFLLPLSILLLICSADYCSAAAIAADSAIMESNGKPGTEANFGTITCLIDGKQKIFTLQQPFFEIRLDMDPKAATDAIEILDGSSNKEGFQFEFKKSGTTKIGNHGSDMNCIINYYNPTGKTYTGEDVTVKVVSYDQKHLTGTFSGKLIRVGSAGASDPSPEFIQIKDGKFDLHD